MKKNKDFKTKKNNKVITLKKKRETLAKCLAMTLMLSKEQYEALSPDAYKKLFGDWKQKELNCLYKIYKTGVIKSNEI